MFLPRTSAPRQKLEISFRDRVKRLEAHGPERPTSGPPATHQQKDRKSATKKTLKYGKIVDADDRVGDRSPATGRARVFIMATFTFLCTIGRRRNIAIYGAATIPRINHCKKRSES